MLTISQATAALKDYYLGVITNHIDTEKVQEISPQ